MSAIGSGRPPCTMDVLIVGAGPSGLAAAITIGKSGHRVHVLDQQPRFGNYKTPGIKMGPNFTRILRSWGLGDALASVTHPIRRTEFVSLETGEIMGHLRWEDPVMKSTGGDMLVGTFEDVLRLMYDLAVRYGAEISYGHKVVAYSSLTSQDKPAVVLEGGRRIEADLIINAAGTASLANISSGLESMNDWRPTGLSTYTAIIPGEKMQSDPELNKLLNDHQDWPCWMGSKRFVLSYPIKQNTAYVLEIFWPDDLAQPWPSSAGTRWIDWSPDAIDFSGCTPIMGKLLKLVTSLQRTPLLARKESLSEWANDLGQIVAIGGSAHPLPPFVLSAVSLGVEDANALGVLFSHISSLSSLPAMLTGFQEIRQPTCDKTSIVEMTWFGSLCLPPGPERDVRDAQMMRAELDLGREQTEEELRAHWESLGTFFTHDATETAEDWWVKWGRLGVARDQT